ncbi:FKBP-type peptidyl-prolyl cis-trans isomerase [Microbacterium sp. YY-01]|uniref:FKBP-type peptidyl-prolyl cis-trans isomerase n=1 Tax=Microbacterium sp. YY-01 TaxID=3421634 RepID=UPI003D183C90
MRLRPLTALSAVAISALLLTGCSGSADPEPDPTADANADAADSQCLLDAQPSEASDAVTVEGSGNDAVVSLPSDYAIDDIARTVVNEGDGDDVHAGDLVTVHFSIVDAADGSVLDSSDRDGEDALPMLLDPQNSSLFVAALECQPLGSSVVLALPSSALGGGDTSLVVYAESVEKLPTIAQGTPVDPVEGMPTVELDDDGAPTITIPDADAPTETQIAVLQQGDGAEVAPGDLVAVQYRGVKWSDGSEFDSTWSRGGTPTQLPTTGVVTGFRKALEGQKVGSQVLVAMPPAEGYGEQEGHELQNETLVFVVDIVATAPIAQ